MCSFGWPANKVAVVTRVAKPIERSVCIKQLAHPAILTVRRKRTQAFHKGFAPLESISAQCRTETLDRHTRGNKDNRSHLAELCNFVDSS